MSGDDLMTPEPLTPPDCDLRDFGWMPLDVTRLRDSDLAVLATGDAFRAAVLLWCASWHQVPAASLPKDDRLLANLAGYGRDMKGWAEVRDEALRGFVTCTDGRLYHPVVAEKALEAHEQREKQKERTKNATNARRHGKRDDDRNKENPRNDSADDQRDVGVTKERDGQRNEVQQTGQDRTIPERDKKKPKTKIESVERESPAGAKKAPSAAPPGSLSEATEKVLKEVEPKRSGLGNAIGTELPEEWTPDDDLMAEVMREFGMAEHEVKAETYAFHAHHASAGSFSANWRASFVTWCKRWKEHKDKTAPPRVQVSNTAPKRPEEFTEADWDRVLAFYAKTGRWQSGCGPDPMSVACKAPKHLWEKHGINEQGERRIPPRKPSEPKGEAA
jgi:hypothetical protein